MLLNLLLVVLLALGFYFIFSDVFGLPTYKMTKTVLSIGNPKTQKKKAFDIYFYQIAMLIAKYIPFNEFKKKRLVIIFRNIGINQTPEMYYAQGVIYLIIWFIIGCILLPMIPLFGLLVMGAGILLFVNYIQWPNKEILAKRKKIEYELPQFTGFIKQEISGGNKNVFNIIENFKMYTQKDLAKELEITLGDMNSGNAEDALTRLETRVGSPEFAEIIRGLVALARGDDVKNYFEMLAGQFRQLESARLRKEILKRPGMLTKYNYMILFAFIATVFLVMGIQIFQTLPALF